MTSYNNWEETERRVLAFFEEHPIGAFKISQVAEYLNLTEREVATVVSHLLVMKNVEMRYRLAASKSTL